MRKIGFFLVSALLLCTSCTKIRQAFNSLTATAENFEEETAKNAAGQRFIKVNFCSADSMVVLSTDFPLTNEGRLTDSIIAFIGQCFEGFDRAYAQTHDPQKALDKVGNAIHYNYKKDIKTMRSELESDADEELPEYLFAWEYESTLEKEYDLERYITLVNNAYEFQGGVHGMPYFNGVTFDKTTGRRIDESILTNTQSAVFKALYKKKLLDYFLSEEEDGETGYLSEYLLIEPENLTLGEMRLTDHSIVFTYQPYEIAPYACGFPTVELTFQQMKPYLTDEGLRLIGE